MFPYNNKAFNMNQINNDITSKSDFKACITLLKNNMQT